MYAAFFRAAFVAELDKWLLRNVRQKITKREKRECRQYGAVCAGCSSRVLSAGEPERKKELAERTKEHTFASSCLECAARAWFVENKNLKDQ